MEPPQRREGEGCAPHARPRQRGGAEPRARVPRPRAGRCARGRGLTRSPVTRAAAAPGVRAPAPPFFLPHLFPPPPPPSQCPALQPERLIHNSARPGSGSTARCGGREAAPPDARRRGWGWGGDARRRPAQLLGAAPLPRRPVPACAPPAPPSRAPSVTPPRRGLTQFGAEVTGSRAPLPAQPPPHSQGPAAGSTPPPPPHTSYSAPHRPRFPFAPLQRPYGASTRGALWHRAPFAPHCAPRGQRSPRTARPVNPAALCALPRGSRCVPKAAPRVPGPPPRPVPPRGGLGAVPPARPTPTSGQVPSRRGPHGGTGPGAQALPAARRLMAGAGVGGGARPLPPAAPPGGGAAAAAPGHGTGGLGSALPAAPGGAEPCPAPRLIPGRPRSAPRRRSRRLTLPRPGRAVPLRAWGNSTEDRGAPEECVGTRSTHGDAPQRVPRNRRSVSQRTRDLLAAPTGDAGTRAWGREPGGASCGEALLACLDPRGVAVSSRMADTSAGASVPVDWDRGAIASGRRGGTPRPSPTRDRDAVRGAGAGAVRGAGLGAGGGGSPRRERRRGEPTERGWGGARVAVPGCGGTIWHPPCLRCRLRRGSRRAKYHKLERQTLAGSGGRCGRHGADSGAAIRSLSPAMFLGPTVP